MGCKLLSNNKGFTLVEVMVGAGLFMMVFLGVFIGSSQIAKLTSESATLNTSDNMVDAIIENIRQSFSTQIITLSKERSVEGLLNDTSKLPMAWSLDIDAPVEQCKECPGRYGYAIQSLGSYAGMYLVTVRFTHRDWAGEARTYEFIVGR
ncbi:MAG: prepilin-type N-terminal cleavage/methylation domain-containing protein [Bdellovibrionales bacterium]|nr:prepilin-type N-terminal cleavage/methylation domain-containing protein [Bdellovibrionales bacterium]